MKLLSSLLITLAIMLPVFSASSLVANAQSFNPVKGPCESINENDPAYQICLDGESPPDQVNDGIIARVANILAFVASVIAVIIIIIAGIIMITSGGDSAKVKKSRDTIIYAAIGLVVIVLSRTIVVFIFERVG